MEAISSNDESRSAVTQPRTTASASVRENMSRERCCRSGVAECLGAVQAGLGAVYHRDRTAYGTAKLSLPPAMPPLARHALADALPRRRGTQFGTMADRHLRRHGRETAPTLQQRYSVPTSLVPRSLHSASYIAASLATEAPPPSHAQPSRGSYNDPSAGDAPQVPCAVILHRRRLYAGASAATSAAGRRRGGREHDASADDDAPPLCDVRDARHCQHPAPRPGSA